MTVTDQGNLAIDDTPALTEPDRVVEIDPLEDPLWQRLILRCPSSVFHSPGWMQALKDTYDLDMRAAILLSEEGEPRAGIPFVPVSDVGGGRRLVSLPFSDYCDPIVADTEEWNQLLPLLLDYGRGVTFRCLHNQVPLADSRFTLVNRAKWHGVDLRPDLEELWSGIDASARRAIRKAEREGVEVSPAQDEADLRAFHEMHLRVRKYKYRMLAQPYAFFQKLWHHFIERHHGSLMLARVGGRVIGGVLFLEWKDTIYYKFNASDAAYLAYRPNDLIIWTAIQKARERGFARLDFGLSDWDQEELSRYKRKYASEEKTISFLRHPPHEAQPAGDAGFRGALKQLTELMTDESVPDSVTGRAGDILYRYFL